MVSSLRKLASRFLQWAKKPAPTISFSKLANKPLFITINRVLIVIGAACFLSVVAVGIIGVVRGYSVQSFWPMWILLFGQISFSPSIFVRQIRIKAMVNTLYVAPIYLLLLMLIHGHHYEIGKKFYDHRVYGEALEEFRKETETWYLQLQYNTSEAHAMEMIAKTYCQLEDFDKARETYKLIIYRYPGFYANRAEKYLRKLENGLKKVTEFSSPVTETNSSSDELYDIALT